MNVKNLSHRLTDVFDIKSAIGTGFIYSVTWGLKCYDLISQIIGFEMAYHRGTLCAKFRSYILVGSMTYTEKGKNNVKF